jgi:hypothetical protein
LLAALAALVGLLLAFSSLSSPEALEEALVRVGARHSAWKIIWDKNKLTVIVPENTKTENACTEGTEVVYKVHCNENPIYVFLSWEFRGLRSNL